SATEKNDAAKTKYDAETLVEEYGRTGQAGLDHSPLAVQILIATIPDPVDSSLAYLFDRHLGALERAAETAGYILDRFDLPWPADNNAQGQQQDSAGSEHGGLRDYERKPGVVLFRSTLEDLGLLVVFLVGETPTAGI